jgi:hypothetical protein
MNDQYKITGHVSIGEGLALLNKQYRVVKEFPGGRMGDVLTLVSADLHFEPIHYRCDTDTVGFGTYYPKEIVESMPEYFHEIDQYK